MRNRNLSALLLMLAFVRSASAGPVEIESLPATTAAPLSAAGVAASALAGPGALAPTLSATALPVFSAPLAVPTAASPSAAAVPAALASLPAAAAFSPAAAEVAAPAFAAIAKVGAPSAERRAAPASAAAATAAAQPLDAGALFDGSARPSAPIFNPFERGRASDAASSAAAGTATPAFPSERELGSLFAAARPNSSAVATFRRMGPFSEVASEIIREYTFLHAHLLEGVRSSPQARGAQGREFIKAVEDLVAVADARQDPASRSFLEALGRFAAQRHLAKERLAARMRSLGMMRRPGVEPRHLPRNDLGSGDYWDMASGMNAASFISDELEPGTHYSFFDLSPFVVSYLDTIAKLKGADATVLEEDITRLTPPARPLAVLRTKNAVNYVPGFEKKLEEMADWIGPGGRLVIQNDPVGGQRQTIIEKHGPLALRLLAQGWELSVEFESAPDAKHALDTLIFTRPKDAARTRTAAQAQKIWDGYVLAAHQAGLADMLRFLFSPR